MVYVLPILFHVGTKTERKFKYFNPKSVSRDLKLVFPYSKATLKPLWT